MLHQLFLLERKVGIMTIIKTELEDGTYELRVDDSWYLNDKDSAVVSAVDKYNNTIHKLKSLYIDIVVSSIIVVQGKDLAKNDRCNYDTRTLTTLTHGYMSELARAFNCTVRLDVPFIWKKDRIDWGYLESLGYPVTPSTTYVDMRDVSVGDYIKIRPNSRTSANRLIAPWMFAHRFEVRDVDENTVTIATQSFEYTINRSDVYKVSDVTKNIFPEGTQLVSSDLVDSVSIPIYNGAHSNIPSLMTAECLYCGVYDRETDRYMAKDEDGNTIGWIKPSDITSWGLYPKEISLVEK